MVQPGGLRVADVHAGILADVGRVLEGLDVLLRMVR